MGKIIEVNNLKKLYGQVEAVKGIDFYVEQGSLFAFLGPNGAGKSTTIDILCTLLQLDDGDVTINGFKLGKDDDKIRNQIGVVFQDSLLDNLLTVEENIMTRGSFYGIEKSKLKECTKKALEVAGATEFAKRPYGKLSGGQRRRADIARALVNSPKILFLDEPTTGLDPQTRKNVWRTIEKLQKEHGMTVFLTTHYMEEAANADYVVVIDNGMITAKGTPLELKEKFANDTLTIKPNDEGLFCSLMTQAGIPFTLSGGISKFTLSHTVEALPILHVCKDSIGSFEVTRGTMDDVFINITGKEIRE